MVRTYIYSHSLLIGKQLEVLDQTKGSSYILVMLVFLAFPLQINLLQRE